MSLGMRHPDDGQLLRYLDGELPGRKSRQVRSHLEACWQCRSELEELENAVNDCVRYRKSVSACLPSPPAPWQDLSRGFERIDARMERGSLAARMARALTPPAVRWTALGATALAVVFAIAYQLRETPSVQASTLLGKAAAAADARPMRARRYRIKTRDEEITRTVGAGRSDSDAPLVAALFRSARYDWDDPLSAKSYRAWREGLAHKRDEVSTVEGRQSPEGGFYRISTTTGDGELVSASLTLRIPDLEPTQGRFEFRNTEWVEMTELPDLPEPPASPVAEATGGIPSKPAMPPLPEEAAPAAAAGIGEELQAVAALHEVGADLGDPLEITNSDGRIRVTGSGISPERQQQIRDALNSLAHVDVRFADAAPPARTERQANPAGAGAAVVPRVDSRLQDKLGGRTQLERFSAQLLDRSDAAMARAYALRRLAQEFSPPAEREMGAPDRRLLRSLAREHLAALAAGFQGIDGAVSPLLPARDSGAGRESGAAAENWQDAAGEALRAAREVETALAALLGTAPAESGADLPSRFASAMSNLKASLERCQHLLSYD
jgi:hypothetical protein